MTRQVSRKHEEDGALLLILMVGVAVMSIGIGVAAQAWSSTWRRENEEELIFRGGQYVDALLAYRKEHGGQFPVDLAELMKPGPRQLRYIRKLYRDPINPTGQWGLLYLMPGGQGIYDAVLAAKQTDSKDGDTVPAGMPGVTPITYNPAGTPGVNPQGLPGAPGAFGAAGRGGPGGAGGRPGLGGGPLQHGPGSGSGIGLAQLGAQGQPGALPGGGVGTTVGAPAARPASGEFSEEEPSEPPIGWPIVGVISRATDQLAAKTFKVYKAHDRVNEWQFHVFERGIDQPQQTETGSRPNAEVPCGPGYGGRGVGCVGSGPRPRGRQWPGPQGPRGQGMIQK